MSRERTVRHVLLDADGVLQRHPGAVLDVVRRVLGGGVDEWLVARTRLRGPSHALHRRVWLTIAVDPGVAALVGSLREAGYAVHLATNQHPHRAAYMRAELGYDELFDSCWYSCDLGAAKPDPAYFRAVVDGLGADPGACLLVDDRTPNVRSARSVGLAAVRWTTTETREVLLDLLAAHGVDPAPPAVSR